MQDDISKNQDLDLKNALKQFFLESTRLEMIYQNLEARFTGIQENVNKSHINLSANLAELNFTNLYLKTILDHISQGIIFIDSRGIITTYNTAAQQILEIPETELLYRSFEKKLKDEAFGFSLKDALNSKISLHTHYVNWVRLNDEKFELEIEPTYVFIQNEMKSVSSYQLIEKPIHGLLLLVRNFTEIRRLQATVNQNNILKELGQMAAHLAHEIRNPLGGIKGFASLLFQDLKDQPHLQEMASYIIDGTDNLNGLVSAILHYTRSFQPQLEQIDLIKFFEDLKLFLKADLSWNSQVILKIEAVDKQIEAPVDLQLFKSAMLNLVVNASQSIPQKGEIIIKLSQKNLEAGIQICDTGEGIKSENLSKIFTPFFTTKQTGSGLGLAEVHKVIQAHNGSIDVQSELGKGTCFTIKIPLKIME